jgi:TRAP-type C4-dicarboxylate transport system substrate-binding protein
LKIDYFSAMTRVAEMVGGGEIKPAAAQGEETMTRLCMALLAWFAAFLPLNAGAEPVILKLSFFASETEVNYARAIKPWVDAVNADPSGAVKIEAYPNGALGKALPAQPQLILDGVADIAFVNPSLGPGRFRTIRCSNCRAFCRT